MPNNHLLSENWFYIHKNCILSEEILFFVHIKSRKPRSAFIWLEHKPTHFSNFIFIKSGNRSDIMRMSATIVRIFTRHFAYYKFVSRIGRMLFDLSGSGRKNENEHCFRMNDCMSSYSVRLGTVMLCESERNNKP